MVLKKMAYFFAVYVYLFALVIPVFLRGAEKQLRQHDDGKSVSGLRKNAPEYIPRSKEREDAVRECAARFGSLYQSKEYDEALKEVNAALEYSDAMEKNLPGSGLLILYDTRLLLDIFDFGKKWPGCAQLIINKKLPKQIFTVARNLLERDIFFSNRLSSDKLCGVLGNICVLTGKYFASYPKKAEQFVVMGSYFHEKGGFMYDAWLESLVNASYQAYPFEIKRDLCYSPYQKASYLFNEVKNGAWHQFLLDGMRDNYVLLINNIEKDALVKGDIHAAYLGFHIALQAKNDTDVLKFIPMLKQERCVGGRTNCYFRRCKKLIEAVENRTEIKVQGSDKCTKTETSRSENILLGILRASEEHNDAQLVSYLQQADGETVRAYVIQVDQNDDILFIAQTLLKEDNVDKKKIGQELVKKIVEDCFQEAQAYPLLIESYEQQEDSEKISSLLASYLQKQEHVLVPKFPCSLSKKCKDLLMSAAHKGNNDARYVCAMQCIHKDKKKAARLLNEWTQEGAYTNTVNYFYSRLIALSGKDEHAINAIDLKWLCDTYSMLSENCCVKSSGNNNVVKLYGSALRRCVDICRKHKHDVLPEESMRAVEIAQSIITKVAKIDQDFLKNWFDNEYMASMESHIRNAEYDKLPPYFAKIAESTKEKILDQLATQAAIGHGNALSLLMLYGNVDKKKLFHVLQNYMSQDNGDVGDIAQKLCKNGAIEKMEKIANNDVLKPYIGFFYYKAAEIEEDTEKADVYFKKAWKYNRINMRDPQTLLMSIIQLLAGKGVKQDIDLACRRIVKLPLLHNNYKNNFTCTMQKIGSKIIDELRISRPEISHILEYMTAIVTCSDKKNEVAIEKYCRAVLDAQELPLPLHVHALESLRHVNSDMTMLGNYICSIFERSKSQKLDNAAQEIFEQSLAKFGSLLLDGYTKGRSIDDATMLSRYIEVFSQYTKNIAKPGRKNFNDGEKEDLPGRVLYLLAKQEIVDLVKAGKNKSKEEKEVITSKCSKIMEKYSSPDVFRIFFFCQPIIEKNHIKHVVNYVSLLNVLVSEKQWNFIEEVDIGFLMDPAANMEKEENQFARLQLLLNIINNMPDEYRTVMEDGSRRSFAKMYVHLGQWLGKTSTNYSAQVIGLFDKAIAYYKRKMPDKLPSALVCQGHYYLAAGEYDKAADCYEKLRDMYNKYSLENTIAKKDKKLKYLFVSIISSITTRDIKIFTDPKADKLLKTVALLGDMLEHHLVYTNYFDCMRVESHDKPAEPNVREYTDIEKITNYDYVKVLYHIGRLYFSMRSRITAIMGQIYNKKVTENLMLQLLQKEIDLKNDDKCIRPISFFFAQSYFYDPEFTLFSGRTSDDLIPAVLDSFMYDENMSSEAKKLLIQCMRKTRNPSLSYIILQKECLDVMKEHKISYNHSLVQQCIDKFFASEIGEWLGKQMTPQSEGFTLKLYENKDWNSLCPLQKILDDYYEKKSGDGAITADMAPRILVLSALCQLAKLRFKYIKPLSNELYDSEILGKDIFEFDTYMQKLTALINQTDEALKEKKNNKALDQMHSEGFFVTAFGLVNYGRYGIMHNKIDKLSCIDAIGTGEAYLYQAAQKEHEKAQYMWAGTALANLQSSDEDRKKALLYMTQCIARNQEGCSLEDITKYVPFDQSCAVLDFLYNVGEWKNWDCFLDAYNDFYRTETIYKIDPQEQEQCNKKAAVHANLFKKLLSLLQKKQALRTKSETDMIHGILKVHYPPAFLVDMLYAMDEGLYRQAFDDFKQYCTYTLPRYRKNFWAIKCAERLYFLVQDKANDGKLFAELCYYLLKNDYDNVLQSCIADETIRQIKNGTISPEALAQFSEALAKFDPAKQ